MRRPVLYIPAQEAEDVIWRIIGLWEPEEEVELFGQYGKLHASYVTRQGSLL